HLLPPGSDVSYANEPRLDQKPQTPAVRCRFRKLNPPSTRPCPVPSASRQAIPAGPTRIGPPLAEIAVTPDTVANGASESLPTAAARVSAVRSEEHTSE